MVRPSLRPTASAALRSVVRADLRSDLRAVAVGTDGDDTRCYQGGGGRQNR
jgi:hypothetical protein